MSWIPRKLAMQLTPLLDLLLIVIFAQFMEVREESKQSDNAREQQAAKIQDELKSIRAESNRLYKQLEEKESRSREDQRQIAEMKKALTQRADELQKRVDRLKSQRDLLAKNLAEMFRVPEKALQEVLEPLSSKEAARTAADLKKLKETIKTLSDSGTPQIVRHVIKYEELLKRCDILEIHVGPENVAKITFGKKFYEFRYSAKALQLVDDGDEAGKNNNIRENMRYYKELQANFEQKFLAYYNQQSELKDLVIILLSRHENASRHTHGAAWLGLNHISQGMRIRSRVIPTELGQLKFITPESE
jgi:hypothetical protein